MIRCTIDSGNGPQEVISYRDDLATLRRMIEMPELSEHERGLVRSMIATFEGDDAEAKFRLGTLLAEKG